MKDKLSANDILRKLDDQLLTSPEQLAVLVCSHKPGDTIKLTVLRKGKEEVLKVKLGATDARSLAAPTHRPDWPMMSPYATPNGGDDDRSLQDLQQRMEQLQRHWQNRRPQNDDSDKDATPPPAAHSRSQSPRTPSFKESHSSSVVTETRDGLTVTLANRDGDKTVKAEENGKVIVDNQAINAAEQLKALPEKVRDRVNELQKQFKEEINPPAPPRGRGPNIAL